MNGKPQRLPVGVVELLLRRHNDGLVAPLSGRVEVIAIHYGGVVVAVAGEGQAVVAGDPGGWQPPLTGLTIVRRLVRHRRVCR
jgi:hypothetical protein